MGIEITTCTGPARRRLGHSNDICREDLGKIYVDSDQKYWVICNIDGDLRPLRFTTVYGPYTNKGGPVYPMTAAPDTTRIVLSNAGLIAPLPTSPDLS